MTTITGISEACPAFSWHTHQIFDSMKLSPKTFGYWNSVSLNLVRSPPLKRITLDRYTSENNNRIIQLTDVCCVLLRKVYMGQQFLITIRGWFYLWSKSGWNCIWKTTITKIQCTSKKTLQFNREDLTVNLHHRRFWFNQS